MNINQLKYFIAVAQTHSFTKAGAQYYISQTAITLQIKQLEEFLDCTLIDRSTRPLTLTKAGRAFLIEAQAIVERVDNAILKTKESANSLEGVLRLGYIKGYERSDLFSKLPSFHDQYPNILISVFRMSSDELAANLLNDNLDVIITWDSTNLRYNPSIKSRFLENAPLVAALYPTHPYANRTALKRSDLRNETILYMTPSSTIDSYGDAHFLDMYHQAGFHPNILFSSSDYESILLMIAAEQGISIMPDYCTKKLDNAENLIFVPMIGEHETEEITLLYKKDNQNNLIIDKLNQIWQ